MIILLSSVLFYRIIFITIITILHYTFITSSPLFVLEYIILSKKSETFFPRQLFNEKYKEKKNNTQYRTQLNSTAEVITIC